MIRSIRARIAAANPIARAALAAAAVTAGLAAWYAGAVATGAVDLVPQIGDAFADAYRYWF